MGIEVDEGYIITLENGKDYLLIQKFDNNFFAVEMIDDDKPSNKFYILKSFVDSQGDMCVEMAEEL